IAIASPARALAQPALLELRYRCSIGVPGGSANSLFLRTLRGPVLDDGVAARTVRWRVEWPRGWLALGHNGAQVAEQPWRWWLGLWPPGPAPLAGEMEQWLLARGQESAVRGPTDGAF